MLKYHGVSTLLNGVCPYYTMYPLEFPLGVLERNGRPGDWVLDPFCGRGTTLFAARVLGLPAVGVDSSPIAVAIAGAKLATARPQQVVACVRSILQGQDGPASIPEGKFWRLAFHRDTLRGLCRLRNAFLARCNTPARVLARAIILGALHGPMAKSGTRYFSNQCPRSFAPKPAYSIRYWEQRELNPPKVDILSIVTAKALRYLEDLPPAVDGSVRRADSREEWAVPQEDRYSWVITSPPYYGMRTYIPDQWLRYWFLGGPSEVAYRYEEQLQHLSPPLFIAQLAQVWRNVARCCRFGARLVVRFGGINDRKAEPKALLTASLEEAGWRVRTARAAGDAARGRRQADQFARASKQPLAEYDVYAVCQS
jgi:hypothetical protein